MSSARPSGRDTACVAVSTAKFGASAPRVPITGAVHAAMSIALRRPMRSAANVSGSANTMPSRTTVPATASPCLSMPKSFAANVDV